jgi:uncharacterized protein (TIGR02246 family)
MSARQSFCIVVAMIALTACAPQPAPPAVDLDAEVQAIRDASANWLEAAQARDGATIDAFFAADATTIFDGEIRKGLDAIREAREQEWTDQPDATISWTTNEVGMAASGDLAYERGHWTMDPDGAGESPEEHGEYLTVWKKTDGQWKVRYDAGTTLKAEEEAPAQD